MTITLPLWSFLACVVLTLTIIIALVFKLRAKTNNSMWRSLFTEGNGEVSVGSVCVFLIIVSYTICLLYATYKSTQLPASPTEIATMSGSIYALKKIESTWEGVTKIKNAVTGNTPAPTP